MEKKSEAELRAEAPVAQTPEKARSLAGEIWDQAQGATPVMRDRGPRNPELTKAVRVLLSYVGESIDD